MVKTTFTKEDLLKFLEEVKKKKPRFFLLTIRDNVFRHGRGIIHHIEDIDILIYDIMICNWFELVLADGRGLVGMEYFNNIPECQGSIYGELVEEKPEEKPEKKK